jgi:hypothetical protein
MLHERNLEFFINLKTILTLWTNILKINLSINSIFSIMGRRFTTDDQWHNKSEAVFAMLGNYPRLLELDLSQELIEGRIPDCEWIDGNIIETLDRISRLCPNLQTLAMRNCPFKYLGFPYDDEYEPNSHPATISENEIQRFGEVLKQWQNLCQLDLRGCNLEIENTLLERLAYALATHPSLSIILIDDCFTTREKELFFKQRIEQQREQLLVNLRATAKTLLFANCLPRLTQFSPIKILEGNQYLMVDILEYADTLKQDRETPYLAVTPHIRFS